MKSRSSCCREPPGSLAVHEPWPPIKIILVSGQLKLAETDIPADSHFFGKPLAATAMIAETRNLIGHA